MSKDGSLSEGTGRYEGEKRRDTKMCKRVRYGGEACELEQRGTGKKNITRKLYKGITGVSIILRRKKDENGFKKRNIDELQMETVFPFFFYPKTGKKKLAESELGEDKK